MRILITGATGFIGRPTTTLLASQGHDLLLLAAEPPAVAVDAHVIVADLGRPTDYESALAEFRPDSCVHLAWRGIPDFSPAVCRRNLNDSASFIDALLAVGSCRSLVVSGSCLEYGITRGACAESASASVTSFFTWAKLALHSYAQLACARAEVSLRWLRIFYAYGPGQRDASLVPMLVREIGAGRVPALAEPANANDFVFVDDVAAALVAAVSPEVPAGVYNVGSGRATPVFEVAAMVEDALRGSGDLTAEMRASGGDANVDFWADIDRAAEVLGFRASTSLEDGISRYIDAEAKQ